MAALDYYQILGVARDASDDEVKKAYRKLVFLHHPDRNPGSAVAETKIRDINAAYEVLGDPETRRTFERLRFGYAAEREEPDESLSPDVILQQMEDKLFDEGRKELFGLLIKDVARIKQELALIRERTVAQDGYDRWKEAIVFRRGREVLKDFITPQLQTRAATLADVATRMMVTQGVIPANNQDQFEKMMDRLLGVYGQGRVAGFASALELLYVRR
jgi:molecular chaperone DnaJ